MAKTDPPLYLGVDVGGTGIKIGLVDDQGTSLGFERIPTNEEAGPYDAIARITDTIHGILRESQASLDNVAGIGLGCPGTMDIPAGLLLEPPNLPHWFNFPIRNALSEATGRPVTFANDGAAAAFGEFWLGSGRNYPSIVMLTLGTGVGGGIIIDGRSIDGECSHGAECGHIIIENGPNARTCSCGQLGHLEAYASATGVIKRTEDAIQSNESSIRARVESGEAVSTIMVAEEASNGDELAKRLILDTAEYLATGIVTLVHTINPSAVILGGAMTFGGSANPIGNEFLTRIRESFCSRTFPVLAEKTVIEFASLGGDAGYLGAAGLARHAYQEQ